MRVRPWWRKAAILPSLALIVSACSPDAATSVKDEAKDEGSFLASAVTCTVAPARGAVECGVLGSAIAKTPAEAVAEARSAAARRELEANAAGDVTIGGQGRFVDVRVRVPRYDATAQQFTFDVSLVNLLTQPLATADGYVADAEGARIFFVSQPTVTSGTGTVTIANADGVGTFTASNQPFYRYAGILPANGLSASRTWVLGTPSTVTGFTFQVFVTAKVPDAAAPGLTTPVANSYTELAVGREHACAVRTGGALYCWGAEYFGQTGRGVNGNSYTPQPIATTTSFTQVVTGLSHACALTADGQAWCWGNNANRQTGWDTPTRRLTPTAVPTSLTFVELDGGANHTCGRTSAGQIHCWGNNGFGQLGSVFTGSTSTPRAIADSLTSYATLSVGYVHSCAITDAGAMRCWGYNQNGELGNGATANSATPVEPSGGHTWKTVAAGFSHTCGITTGDALYCWGWNGNGSIGNGTTTHSTVPVAVTLPAGTPAKVFAGNDQTCVITTTGTTYCWGGNWVGQVGNGVSGAPVLSPTTLAGNPQFTTLSLNNESSCGREASGVVRCWGLSGTGAVGENSEEIVTPTPTPVQTTLSFTSVAAGQYFTCGTSTTGQAYCWGENSLAQLGNGRIAALQVPWGVLGGGEYLSVSAGAWNSCGRLASGETRCWGYNSDGNLGNGQAGGNTANRYAPNTVSGGHQFVQVVSGTLGHSCGLKANGEAWCWGRNWSGQVGAGNNAFTPAPTLVAGGLAFAKLSAGSEHTCGITTAGKAYCWGLNAQGNLGDGTTTNRFAPTAVLDPADGPQVYRDIVSGAGHNCAVTQGGTAYCWGSNGARQVGANATPGANVTTPLRANDDAYTALAAGSGHTCGIRTDGRVQCWGSNSSGQLGWGANDATQQSLPKLVAGEEVYTRIAAGGNTTCGITGGRVKCWGSGTHYQHGQPGSTSLLLAPAAVVLP